MGNSFRTSRPPAPPPAPPPLNPILPPPPVLPEQTAPVLNYLTDWSDNVIGMTEAKRAIDASYSLPRKFQRFTDDIERFKGFLLWGPPGTGKTLLASTFAQQANLKFSPIVPGELLSKWVGESQQKIKKVFDDATKEPTLLFIDELDGFARNRTEQEADHERSFKNQLLMSLQDFMNTQHSSILFACCNHVTELDSAVLRRFPRTIYCDLPTTADRYELLRRGIPNRERDQQLTDAILRGFAERMERFSGSDVTRFLKQIRNLPLLEVQQATHFRRTLSNLWTPASPQDPGAELMTLSSLPSNGLDVRRQIQPRDFEILLETSAPTLTEAEHEKYKRELSIVGGSSDLTKVIKADAFAGPEPRTRRQREIDFILTGIPTDLDQLTLDHISHLDLSVNAPEHNDIFSLVEKIPRFISLANAGGENLARKLQLQAAGYVMMGLLLVILIPYLFWIVLSVVGMAMLTLQLFIPVALSLKDISDPRSTTVLDTSRDTFIMFAFSFFACLWKSVEMTGLTLVDTFALSFILLNLQMFAAAMLSSAGFFNSNEVGERELFYRSLDPSHAPPNDGSTLPAQITQTSNPPPPQSDPTPVCSSDPTPVCSSDPTPVCSSDPTPVCSSSSPSSSSGVPSSSNP